MIIWIRFDVFFSFFVVRMTLRELLKRYPSGKIPELDPLEDIGIKDEAVVAAVAAEKAAKAELEELAGGGEVKF